MSDRYPRIYAMLKRAGHSAAKSLEIIIDAKRGEAWAIQWIKMLNR